jgi:hypothetical protein
VLPARRESRRLTLPPVWSSKTENLRCVVRTLQISLTCIVFTLVLSACGPTLPPKTDLLAAREALTKSLDAWVQGQSADSLKTLKPPISFRDVQWENGAKLINYKIEKEESSGHSGRFTVKLSLAEKSGAKLERSVTYIADAGSPIVIRPEF